MDSLLKKLGASLHNIASQYEGSLTGRLNGSDFVVLLPGCQQTENTAQRVHEDFLRITTQMQLKNPVVIPAAASLYQVEDTPQTLLIRTDSALAAAETEKRSCLKLADLNTILPETCSASSWQELIQAAIQNKRGALRETPVTAKDGQQAVHLPGTRSLDRGWLPGSLRRTASLAITA